MGMLKSVSGQTDTTFVSPYHDSHFDQLVGAFSRLTVAVNEINRSLGQPDLYPFVLSSPVIEKLRYIDTLIASHRNPS